ncbi:transcription factor Sox-9-B isoform X2 [Orussus abietinus]|uniref:transcription factor Sox-9-B isoform X2 n=1 Tax=Orussus abietinus TaxID=222816 RepID=UPI000C716080|nr:transcription factor Sox-9-B isoform X2 [Orussus abietinus]
MAANEQQRKDQQDLREPAHHARRPMNAFLIFCKRHRGSVRSGFPHLENRAVTRVLGEWWATLQPEQKRSYTNLAQEYKDAFLNANPDFKWYKLPAPPLRTLTTRPTNKKPESSPVDQGHDTDAIQPGKLADESQIGGLSTLFTPQKVQTRDDDLSTDNDITDVPKPPKKRFTELPVSPDQKRDCKADLFGEKNTTKPESNNNDQHQLRYLNFQNVEDEKNNGETYFEGNGSSEENTFRGERTCKGLRYQKFLVEQLRNVGSGGQQNKRRRTTGLSSSEEQTTERRNSISSNVSEKTDSLSSESGNSSRSELEHLVESAEGKLEASKPEETETEGAESQLDYGPWTARKRFRAEDFNLEKKIEALPSLSLEEFQEKKKQQRTKKKTMQKQNSTASRRGQGDFLKQQATHEGKKSPQTGRLSEAQEEAERQLLVGSQKRKARKQSITRNAAASNASKRLLDQEPNDKTWCASPDLEALACLATVAANRTKLTK